MKETLKQLLSPAFLFGYTTLIAVIFALFYFHLNEEVVMTIITLLSNIITGVVSHLYTKHQALKELEIDGHRLKLNDTNKEENGGEKNE